MGLFDSLCNGKNSAKNLLAAGAELERKNDLEGAFEKYKQAADLGNTEAMMAIVSLYLSKPFRQIEKSNMLELMQRGVPVLPWNLVTRKEPDYKSALEWCLKAADLGNGRACYTAGCFLCEGIICRGDIEKGTEYLEKAVKAGVPGAKEAIYLFKPSGERLTDEAYESCLELFAQYASVGNAMMYKRYSILKSGTPKQLARLGYVLIAAQNNNLPNYGVFKYSFTDSGIPFIPAAPKRMQWKTFLRFDLNAFEAENPLIAISSDIIHPKSGYSMLGEFHHAALAGTAAYRSPAFGWLGEEKAALVFRLDKAVRLNAEAMAEVVNYFSLTPEEYEGDSVAFMVDSGEKEYSVEIACINGDKVDVLWRYTVDGSSEVHEYFEPELLSLNIND
ncbi:MAG: sel1 repeat family protein [Oscillospiraceae bacterium]|nr:sel1 repeat family protein [Oscillospiraceae bacterium]